MSEQVIVKDLIIVGAGDFGREVAWLAERINQSQPTWNILGFVDDAIDSPEIDGYRVLGNIKWLLQYDRPAYVVCAIGNGKTRELICNKLENSPCLKFATLVDPTVICGKGSRIGAGSICCAGTILTVNVQLGDGCIVNLNSTIGHDSVLGNYSTLHPGVSVSGKVVIGRRSLLGTGTKVIQGLKIEPDTTIGAGAVVIHDIKESGTYVGIPARKIK